MKVEVGAGPPDLEVGAPSVSDASLVMGGSFTLSATVRNTGAGGSAATTLRWYRSTNDNHHDLRHVGGHGGGLDGRRIGEQHEVGDADCTVGSRAALSHLYHPSNNLVSHHAVMMDRTGEWHYKCAFEDRLHECLAGSSRSGSDAQGVVDRLLGRFGTGRLAHVQGAPVATAEGGGDALLSFEDAP